MLQDCSRMFNKFEFENKKLGPQHLPHSEKHHLVDMIPQLQIKEHLPPFHSLPSYQYNGKQYYSADDIIGAFFQGKSQKTSKIIGVLHSDHKTVSNIIQRDLGFRRVKKSAIILSFTAVIETILKITKGNKDQDRLILHLFQTFKDGNDFENSNKEADQNQKTFSNVISEPQPEMRCNELKQHTSCEPSALLYYMQTMPGISANPLIGASSTTPNISHLHTQTAVTNDHLFQHHERIVQNDFNQVNIGSAFPMVTSFSSEFVEPNVFNGQDYSLNKKRKCGPSNYESK